MMQMVVLPHTINSDIQYTQCSSFLGYRNDVVDFAYIHGGHSSVWWTKPTNKDAVPEFLCCAKDSSGEEPLGSQMLIKS